MSELMELGYDCSFITRLPTELLDYIFECLPASDLMKSRRVCRRWKTIIDGIASNEIKWMNFCRRDFNAYSIARLKANPHLTWYNLYKSLYLWPKVDLANEHHDKLTEATCLADEVRNLEVVSKGVLALHKKCVIEYYDIETLKLTPMQKVIKGDYSWYTENDYVIVIRSHFCHLFVIVKDNAARNDVCTFDDVKSFLLTGTKLFIVKLNYEIYFCDITNKCITPNLIHQVEDGHGIMSLGYANGSLNILTYKRNIYSIGDSKKVIFQQSLNMERNLLDVLHKYNFLEKLDWHAFYQWLYFLHLPLPKGAMFNISVIQPYGDTFFVGTSCGVLFIYHKPYIDGKLDIFNSRPVRQVDFTEPLANADLQDFTVMKIDVVEIENGHAVFVAVPRKVVVLKYTHFPRQSPTA